MTISTSIDTVVVGAGQAGLALSRHLTARGRTEKEANDLLDRLSAQIEERLGNSVFSFAGETMEEVVGLKLTLGGYTVSVAESCTGGLLAQRLTDVPGSSKYFIGGVIAYANEVKTKALGVEPMLLMEHGAVSAPVAEADCHRVRGVVELASRVDDRLLLVTCDVPVRATIQDQGDRTP